MQHCYMTEASAQAIPIIPLTEADWPKWHEGRPVREHRWLTQLDFRAEAEQFALVPNAAGELAYVLAGLGRRPDLFALAELPNRLPLNEGGYRLDLNPALPEFADWALGWGLGAYRFERYKRKAGRAPARLCLPAGAVARQVQRQLQALTRVRDLINIPAGELYPEALAAVVRTVGEAHGASVETIQGQALTQGYPLVAAVGRASAHPPCLVDLRWGDPTAPRLTLVGKGVCFDSGGLDLKPASGMRLMKKDMGGAAHALGLAELVMAGELPVYLRLLIPAVENAVAGNAFRPGDVLPSRKGLSVEIENTDAEGRLVLADALAAAVEVEVEVESDGLDLLIDFATLTGAARVALGSEVPVFFTADEDLARALMGQAQAGADPLWRLPLHRDYRPQLDSQVADLLNAAEGRYGGAITAALFLREFVGEQPRWLHVDLMAWNLRARPGRPKGGEAMGLRAIYALLAQRYGGSG